MKKSKIFKWVSIALMGALLILHTLVPFWNYGTDPETSAKLVTSIQKYLWYIPSDKMMAEYLAPCFVLDGKNDYLINHVVFMPVVVLVCTVAGIAISLWKKNALTSLIPLFCGVVGTWEYLTNPAFQLGNLWVLHLVVCILMVLAAVARIVFAKMEEER